MHGVQFVAAQTTGLAFVDDLRWASQKLDEAEFAFLKQATKLLSRHLSTKALPPSAGSR